MSHEIVERGSALEPATRLGPRDPDAELVERWRAGDAKAFEALVLRYQARVLRLLTGILGASEAEDAAQEAFLNLHRHGQRYRGESRFSTFLYRVAVNAALNRRRTLGRGRARVEKLARETDEHSMHSPDDPEQATSTAQLREQVQEALAALPPKLKLPVALFDIEGLSYADVSAILGIAEGTVKSRIHRGRMQLRANLAPHLSSLPNGGEA